VNAAKVIVLSFGFRELYEAASREASKARQKKAARFVRLKKR